MSEKTHQVYSQVYSQVERGAWKHCPSEGFERIWFSECGEVWMQLSHIYNMIEAGNDE